MIGADVTNNWELMAIMEKTIKELQAKNIEIIRGPLEIECEETWVYFSDPDGNVLEYIEWYK